MKKNLLVLPLFLLLISITFSTCLTASGSSIVTGEKREPIDPSLVKLYVEKPQDYEIIGIVSASSDWGLTEQESVDYAIEELKKQAAMIGANGLILEKVDQSTTVVPMVISGISYYVPVTEKTVSGKAVFVKE